jgi:integrase
MRVELKGLHSVRRRLPSGGEVVYHYAWRGGPRLKGEPGSPEFLEQYLATHRAHREPKAAETLKSVIISYKESAAFTRLRDRTKRDYSKQIVKVENAFGDLPLAALDDPRVTRHFIQWRDKLAAKQSMGKQADYAWFMLMRLVSFARGLGLTTYRVPERIERLYHADRSNKIWEAEQIAAFMAVAPETLQQAMVLAMDTGQRQGDLLVFPWSGYDGARIRLRQSKSRSKGKLGREVVIPVTQRLKAVLDGMKRVSPVVLTNARGQPWGENAFRKAWALATKKAGIEGLTFHDLRGTAVTRLSEAGCTPQEIATITGHSLGEVQVIIDKYLARTEKLAVAAIAKLERGRS